MLLRNQIKTVAEGLKPILNEFVFVGGAVVECYVTTQDAESARQTDDIDVVVGLAHYGSYAALQENLIAAGFNPDIGSKVICRYEYRGIIVDIMPDNASILGFSNRWYNDGIRHAELFPIDDISIKILPAPLYLASKIEAYRHRGATDKRLSPDFEDIVYVLENRPEVVDEITASEYKVKQYLSEFMRFLLQERDLNEGIRAVLGYSPLPGRVEYVASIIRSIREIGKIDK
jgi:predicted nucleotidyltransferase